MQTFISWAAFGIALIALLIAWTAFNRSGEDLEALVEREAEEAVADLRVDFEALENTVRQGTAESLEEGADAAREGAEETEEAAQDVRTEE